jgi:hypothetical protein
LQGKHTLVVCRVRGIPAVYAETVPVQHRCPRGELTRRAQEIDARHLRMPHSAHSHSVAVDSCWMGAPHRNLGFEALSASAAPQARQNRGQSRTITAQLADLIERENPNRIGTTLLRELALSSG